MVAPAVRVRACGFEATGRIPLRTKYDEGLGTVHLRWESWLGVVLIGFAGGEKEVYGSLFNICGNSDCCLGLLFVTCVTSWQDYCCELLAFHEDSLVPVAVGLRCSNTEETIIFHFFSANPVYLRNCCNRFPARSIPW